MNIKIFHNIYIHINAMYIHIDMYIYTYIPLILYIYIVKEQPVGPLKVNVYKI